MTATVSLTPNVCWICPCCRAKAHQQELEDVALDLRAELDEVRAKQEAAEQAAAAAAQRATAAEAKLEAAGLGAMPKMGPTAEQLVINSTQRIRWVACRGAGQCSTTASAHACALMVQIPIPQGSCVRFMALGHDEQY